MSIIKKLKFYAALWLAKLSVTVLRLFGQDAGYMPGVIALKISKDFLSFLKPPGTVIAVSGTNGKTTTSNLITSVLRANGCSVTNNSLGANVQAGVAAALLTDSTLTGKAKKDIAVLEVDERSSILIYSGLKPDYLICNNLMRDSVERNANTDFISYVINKKLPDSTVLVLNADDLICSSLGKETARRIYFGLDAERPESSERPPVCDTVYCPKCGGRLEAEYIRYFHLGRYRCPDCAFASPVPDFVVTDIDRDGGSFTVSHAGKKHSYRLINDNIVNVYNFCAAVALLTELGLPDEKIAAGFDKSEIVTYRYNRFEGNGVSVVLQAGKGRNPVAVSRGFDYTRAVPGEHKCVIVNVDDVEKDEPYNVCWLSDCDYRPLADKSIEKVIFSGPFGLDHRLRALLAGVPDEKISVCHGISDAVKAVKTDGISDIYLIFDFDRIKESENAARLITGDKTGEGKK